MWYKHHCNIFCSISSRKYKPFSRIRNGFDTWKSSDFMTLLVLGMSVFQAKCRTLNEASMSERHEEWMALFGRTYKNDAEKEKRFLIFKDNVELIESFNKVGNRPYKLNINEYADQTIEEFQASRNGYKRPFSRPSTQKPSRYENVSELPSSIDWTKKGGVTPVTDQNQCVAAVEGITQQTTGKLMSLSEQELVDCDTSGESQGRKGGSIDDAFEFIIQNEGIASEANYPYHGVDGTCNKTEEASHDAKISGYEDVPANSEMALLKAVLTNQSL